MRRLSTSSYGVLAMLAMRPWSAYELSTKVRPYLSECLGPRAATSVYQEPKTLVAHGLARGKTETYGRRTRTVYSITAKGRRALRNWLQDSSAPPIFASEAVARTIFSEFGDRRALVGTLTELEEQVAAMRQRVTGMLTEFFDDVGLTPHRTAMAPVVGKLYFGYLDLLEEWARWAREEVQGWPDQSS